MRISILILVFVIGLTLEPLFGYYVESYVFPFLVSFDGFISGIIFKALDFIMFKARFFIIFMLLGFLGGLRFNYILPKINLVFKIIIVILLLVSIAIIGLILLSNHIELKHLSWSPVNVGPDDGQNGIDVAQMVANSEFIDQQEATIHENERKLRKLYKEIGVAQNRMDRIRKREVRLKIWNFVLSVISGILASILFHYLSEILNWN